jgi:histidinol-phosphatase (PHP family)
MDKIKMFNKTAHYFNEHESWYKDQINLTLNAIKQSGSIVEINTRGWYRYNQPELYPGETIIQQLIKENIPVTISSDAHDPGEILKGIPEAASVLKRLGLKRLTALFHEKWNEYPFDQEGIRFDQMD